MIVSVSRELGAGGGTVGEALARVLGGPLLDERWFITQLTERYRFSDDFLARNLERPPSFGESLISALARATVMMPGADVLRMPEEEVIHAVRSLVCEQAQHGHVVVIGLGGVSMLGWRPTGVPVLAILLQARREWRVAQLARRYGITAAEAGRRIAITDDARVRYHQHYFRANMYDSSLYDLVFNTEVLGLETTVDLATRAVRDLCASLASAR